RVAPRTGGVVDAQLARDAVVVVPQQAVQLAVLRATGDGRRPSGAEVAPRAVVALDQDAVPICQVDRALRRRRPELGLQHDGLAGVDGEDVEVGAGDRRDVHARGRRDRGEAPGAVVEERQAIAAIWYEVNHAGVGHV